MEMLPRSSIDEYTKRLNALSKAGRQMLLNALTNLAYEDIAELRELSAEAMEMICGELTDLAAVEAAEFYDDMREVSVGKRYGALADSFRKPEATYGAVKALVSTVVKTGNVDKLERDLGDRIDYEVKKAAGDCVANNASRDPLKPRFARVPTGAETCLFCRMLASRGFVYRNDKSAGAGNHWHPNCDCRIVPGFEGVTIEGYNPIELYNDFIDSTTAEQRRAISVSGSNRFKSGYAASNQVVSFSRFDDVKEYLYKAKDQADLEHRYSQLINLYGVGSPQTVSKSVKQALRHVEKRLVTPPSGIVIQKGALPLGKELNVAKSLTKKGFAVEFQKPKEVARTADLLLDGVPWEIKQPVGSGKNTIYHQFAKAKGQSDKIIIDASELFRKGTRSQEYVEEEVQRQLSKSAYFTEAIIIADDRYFRRYKNTR